MWMLDSLGRKIDEGIYCHISPKSHQKFNKTHPNSSFCFYYFTNLTYLYLNQGLCRVTMLSLPCYTGIYKSELRQLQELSTKWHFNYLELQHFPPSAYFISNHLSSTKNFSFNFFSFSFFLFSNCKYI